MHRFFFPLCIFTPIFQSDYQWRIQTGAQQVRAPSKFWSTMCFFIQFCIKMFQKKARLVWESILETLQLPAPLSGPWTPAVREVRTSRCTHIIFCSPSILKSWIRPWITVFFFARRRSINDNINHSYNARHHSWPYTGWPRINGTVDTVDFQDFALINN